MDPVQVSVTVCPTLVGTVTVLEGGVDACEVPTPITPATSPTASMAWKSARLRSVATMPTRVRLMGPLPVIGQLGSDRDTRPSRNGTPNLTDAADRRAPLRLPICTPRSLLTIQGVARSAEWTWSRETPPERKSKPARFADSTCPRFLRHARDEDDRLPTKPTFGGTSRASRPGPRPGRKSHTLTPPVKEEEFTEWLFNRRVQCL